MRKSLSLVLAALLVIITGITTVFADVKEYDLYIGGVRVTSENAGNVFGDGSVMYDGTENILYLNNAKISKCSVIEYTETDPETKTLDTGAYIYYGGKKDLTVMLTGENEITAEGSDLTSFTDAAPDGISVNDTGSDIIFMGTGSLKIMSTSETDISDGVFSYGGVVIDGPDMTIVSANRGIHAIDGDVTVKNSDTDIQITSKIGIRCSNGKVEISDAKISINDTENGILTKTGDINILGTYTDIYINGGKRAIFASATTLGTVSGNCMVNTKGRIKIENAGFGISAGTVYVRKGILHFDTSNKGIYASEGNVIIEGGELYLEGSLKNPILSDEDIVISGGHVKTEATWGLWANGRITILGGYIEISAEEDGLLQTREDGNIVITGGTLVLKTEKGPAFSYDEDGKTQIPDLSGYKNASIDYGNKKGRNLKDATDDKFWENGYVVIRAAEEDHGTTKIEIGKAETETESEEENPDTGVAPILCNVILSIAK